LTTVSIPRVSSHPSFFVFSTHALPAYTLPIFRVANQLTPFFVLLTHAVPAYTLPSSRAANQLTPFGRTHALRVVRLTCQRCVANTITILTHSPFCSSCTCRIATIGHNPLIGKKDSAPRPAPVRVAQSFFFLADSHRVYWVSCFYTTRS